MKLPRYLVVSLIITVALILWSVVSTEQETTQHYQPRAVRSHSTVVAEPLSTAKNRNGQVIDLFPVFSQTERGKEQESRPEPAIKTAPQFPLQVVGAWWENNNRIVILNDGDRNVLLCKTCQMNGYIRPGEEILTDWRLTELAEDHLSVEWLPENISNRIELGDLTSKPAR